MKMNILQYATNEDAKFRAMANEMGYVPKTTFYSDLSIAECYGADAIKDTYNNVLKSWKNNTEYFTEFVLCLNWKIWEFYESNESLARLYNDLWDKASQYVEEHWNDEQLQYYYATTD